MPACGRRSVALSMSRSSAPAASADSVVALEREADGFFSGELQRRRGRRSLLLSARWRSTPARSGQPPQPEGPHGPSAIVDPSSFAWTDRGLARREPATGRCSTNCTSARSRRKARGRRPLSGCRISPTSASRSIEMMPVADFAGRWGWGYDGVNLYAPTRLYGTPDDLRRFVDRAHALGLGVILDVVYNHLGPGRQLSRRLLAPTTSPIATRTTGAASLELRGAVGRRATSSSRTPRTGSTSFTSTAFASTRRRTCTTRRRNTSLAELTRRARAAAGARQIYVVAENEPQDTRLVRDAVAAAAMASTRC